MNEVFDAGDSSILSQGIGNDAVITKSGSLSVDLSVSSLVDELANIVTGWVSVSDVWLDKSDHVDGGTVKLDKHSVVELSQTEKLHNLLLLWSELVDTNDKKRKV